MFDTAALIAAFVGIASAVVSLFAKALSGWFVARKRVQHADVTIRRLDGSIVRIEFMAGDISSAEKLVAELTRVVGDKIDLRGSVEVNLSSEAGASTDRRSTWRGDLQ